MIRRKILFMLFTDSYDAIKQQIESISHSVSVQQPPFGGNCIHWITGHLVVARCNLLLLLDVPSIWQIDKCKKFVPGSSPIINAEDAIPFETIRTDLERTQDLLVTCLNRASDDSLLQIKGDQSVAEQFITYHAHEAYHLGQLEILCQLLDSNAYL